MVDKILLAEPRGFCAGVEMAIKALTWLVRVVDGPVYCYHEIVHNSLVVDAFRRSGVIFVDDIDEVPEGAAVMLSAHGSAPEVVAGATRRAAVMVDAVCPLVTKVHHEVRRRAADGYDIIYVGHAGHDEAIGTVAEAPDAVTLIDPADGLRDFTPDDTNRVALVAQTTLGVFEWEGVLAEARRRFPKVWTARRSDLCYATTNRQEAVVRLAAASDLVLVVGSANSSNTRALVRVAEEAGARAFRVDDAASVRPEWFDGARVVGVTAGASAPDASVRAVIAAVSPEAPVELLSVTTEEEYFPPPPRLRALLGALQGAVEGGVTARHPGRPGRLDDDRTWGATEALENLGV